MTTEDKIEGVEMNKEVEEILQRLLADVDGNMEFVLIKGGERTAEEVTASISKAVKSLDAHYKELFLEMVETNASEFYKLALKEEKHHEDLQHGVKWFLFYGKEDLEDKINKVLKEE